MIKIDLDLKVKEMLNESLHTKQCEAVLGYALELMKDACIPMSVEQQMTLTSHICAMVNRSINGGEIPFIDKEMFSEVSPQSIISSSSL